MAGEEEERPVPPGIAYTLQERAARCQEAIPVQQWAVDIRRLETANGPGAYRAVLVIDSPVNAKLFWVGFGATRDEAAADAWRNCRDLKGDGYPVL